MNWITITADNLRNAKVADLVDALRTAALAAGQTDRSTEIIENVVTRIRAEVQACTANLVDADETTIPRSLKALAARMIIWDLKNALEMDPTEAEKIDHSSDEAYLRRVAEGKVPIDDPDNPIAGPVQPTTGSPRVNCRPNQFSREAQEGI